MSETPGSPESDVPADSPPLQSQMRLGVKEVIALVSMVGAAAWTAWLYVTYQKSFNDLSKEQIRLNNAQIEFSSKQAQRLANTEADIRHTTLAQQEFDLNKGKALLTSELSRATLSTKQQEILLTQSQRSMTSELERLRLSNQVMQADRDLKSVELEQARRGLLTSEIDFKVHCTSTKHIYRAGILITIRNGPKQDVIVGWSFLRTYFANRPSLASSSEAVGFAVNSPPVFLVAEKEAQPLKWKRLTSNGYVFAGESKWNEAHHQEILRFLSSEDIDVRRAGGGATKRLIPGDSALFSTSVVFSAPVQDGYVGASYVFGIDGAVEGPDVYHLTYYAALPDCEAGDAAT